MLDIPLILHLEKFSSLEYSSPARWRQYVPPVAFQRFSQYPERDPILGVAQPLRWYLPKEQLVPPGPCEVLACPGSCHAIFYICTVLSQRVSKAGKPRLCLLFLVMIPPQDNKPTQNLSCLSYLLSFIWIHTEAKVGISTIHHRNYDTGICIKL